MAQGIDEHDHGRPLTGRTVLICLLGFFGVVFGVNAIMVRAAMTSFGGVETESSYKAGLAFKQETARAEAQEARHWKVAAHLMGGEVDVNARDAAGKPLTGLELSLALHHPTDRRLDVQVEPQRVGAGEWRGAADVAPGQWDLVIELSRDGERLFRSTNRVVTR